MNELIRRRNAAQAVFDRFNGEAFAWGRVDCVRLGAATLRAMGRKVSLAKGGSYTTATGALRALKRAGFDSLEAAVDGQQLLRIAPAQALPCDLIGLPGAEHAGQSLLALCVALGGGRVLGVRDGVEMGLLQPSAEGLAHAIAWRV